MNDAVNGIDEERHYDNLTPKERQDFRSKLMEAAGVPPWPEEERLSIIEQRVKAKFDEALRRLNTIAE